MRDFPESTRKIKLESTKRKFDKTSVFIDNSQFATDGYKTYKYWKKKHLKTLIRTNYTIR